MDNYIGVKFSKPLSDYDGYSAAAAWCNESGKATIEDKGDWYEVVGIPEPSFSSELAAAKRREIYSAGDAILAQVKAGYSQGEIESWSKQEQGAKDFKAGTPDTEAAQYVAAIAAARGIETETLVGKILANVASYGALSAAVIGEQQRLDDLLKAAEAAQDRAALASIAFVWPKP